MSQAIVAVLWMDAESVVKGAKKNSLVGLSPFACPISWTILLGNRNDDDGDMCAGRLTQPLRHLLVYVFVHCIPESMLRTIFFRTMWFCNVHTTNITTAVLTNIENST